MPDAQRAATVRGERSPAAAGSPAAGLPMSPVPIQRHRAVTDTLDRAVRNPTTTVVLMCAPAGTGKTVVVSDWVARAVAADGGPVAAWVGVSTRHRRAADLWAAVCSALDTALGYPPGSGTAPAAGLRPGHPRQLATDLGRCPHPIVLVVDNAHLLHDPVVLADLAVFVDALAAVPNATVLFLARREPSLPWHTWAAVGILARIGWEELALDERQVRAVLAEHDSSLDDADVAALTALTDGWAALVRIAAIHLHTRKDRHAAVADLARSPHPISDQLVGDLLTALPNDLLTFLLSTCIVDSLTVDLCEHLTGTNASDVLDALERTAFPLLHTAEPGSATITHRYHPMLLAHLRAELHRTDPARESLLHARAAQWYLAGGSPVDALGHLVAARDAAAALDLARQHGPAVVLGRGAETFFLHLDQLALSATRTVRLLHALDAVEHGCSAAARALLDTLPPAVEDAAGRIETLLEAAVDTVTALADGRAPRPAALVELRGHTPTGCLPLESHARTVLAATLFPTDPAAAEALLDEAAALAGLAGHPRLQVRCAMLSAWVHRSTGDLGRMHTAASTALAIAERHGDLDSPDAQHAVALVVLAAHLRGERVDPSGTAGRFLTAATESPGATPAPPHLRLVFDLYRLADGVPSPDRLAAAVANAAAAYAGPFGPGIADVMPYFAGALLTLGRSGDAAYLHRRMVDLHGCTADTTVLGAMLEHARGHHKATRAMLAELTGESSTPLRAARVHLLDALAALRLNNTEAMQTSARRALDAAEPHCLARPFLDAAADSAELLTTVAPGIDRSYRFADALRRSLAVGTARCVPTLTASERVVLAHLPSGRTAEEIGRELQVSVNTVKTHIRNLYRKFEVGTRGEAISAALRYGLL